MPRGGGIAASPVVDDFFTAAQSTAEITAGRGNHEMWQLVENGAVPKRD